VPAGLLLDEAHKAFDHELGEVVEQRTHEIIARAASQ
jgi:hypothetical protein